MAGAVYRSHHCGDSRDPLYFSAEGHRIGSQAFGPVMLVWFVTLAITGIFRLFVIRACWRRLTRSTLRVS
jgi:hypothetical protein